jgi:hypothetical protein
MMEGKIAKNVWCAGRPEPDGPAGAGPWSALISGRPADILPASLPGLTRQSIHICKILAKKMDARVKPAHDRLQYQSQV